MIIISNGTVFNTDAQAIVNTVNCKGVMGAGIALEFQLRFPEMFACYESKCEAGDIRIGKMDYYDNGDLMIINFPTKYDFKYPSKIEWVEQGLQDFVDSYSSHGIESVAFPKLGAGKGGLNWEEVKDLIKKYIDPLNIKAYICEDTLPYAEGTERIMLEKFNSMPAAILSSHIRLNEKQRVAIEKGKPYRRFWHIGNTESIGTKAYENIFKYFYGIANNSMGEQLTLF